MITRVDIVSPLLHEVQVGAQTLKVCEQKQVQVRNWSPLASGSAGSAVHQARSACRRVLNMKQTLIDSGFRHSSPQTVFWEKLDHLPGCASRPASRREGSFTENASKSRSGLQSGAQGSRHGEPRATTICRYCQVGGRPHRATRRKPCCPRHAFGWMVASEIANPTIRRLSSSLCDHTIHFRKLWERG
jgi:hypothetical protein